MRRLSLLFVLVLIVSTLVLRVLEVSTPHGALLTATFVTLFVWSVPLLKIFYNTVSRLALSLDALQQASGFVCWTYGFAIGAVPIVTVTAILCPTRGLHLVLPRLLVIAAIATLASTMSVSSFRLPRSRPQPASNLSHSNSEAEMAAASNEVSSTRALGLGNPRGMDIVRRNAQRQGLAVPSEIRSIR